MSVSVMWICLVTVTFIAEDILSTSSYPDTSSSESHTMYGTENDQQNEPQARIIVNRYDRIDTGRFNQVQI